MTKKAKTETELQAWDIYFAAALEQARSSANGGNADAYQSNLVKIAGEIADKMLEARRLRA
ncbi:hypothetical protein G7021_28360 [Pseudomonas carnis]|jgi:signal recognition particle GTPase|uniref:Uncharacterized protein n=1 Tax=Pseudomonas carnis TaxID=2487355 RepID=A0ABT5RC45_9PSED|nr:MULTISPECIES: hypothetical protein [Pseudomonas]MBA1256574.1 hypothetical protein [Pseudomonas carnis]MBA1267680.1 hypothetical protein [Pseudomonas carnis]MCP9734341.1 hypothetical protein [Pseudomonas sp. GBPI_506]MDD1943554.1 hypothetical protein [Pseudomonas carnis]TPV56977.1 hypothetical protein FJ692_12390 [Pseudomonas fluorescens]